ncbi:MAG TPA: chorismate mutase [Acidimicrobiales bacterium]|jgi:chorismate mutase|nr:chorismate mutase [Acidimicrobiales bacterium]
MTFAMVRGLRGASTCAANTPEEINEVTQELLLAMLERNDISHDDVISVLFTTTPDLTASFPATAARGVGFGDVPLLCASEIDVPGAMPLTVRVLLHAYTERARNELRHVYLRNAGSLRDDLPE